MESKGTVTRVDEESLDVLSNLCESVVHGNISSLVAEDRPENDENDLLLEASAKISTMTFEEMVETFNDPISLELAAISHVSQTISSLRRMSHIQWINHDIPYNGNQTGAKKPPNFVCVCGDADCIDVCDIHEWLPSPTLKLDRKLRQLVPLVGKSYLVLGQVYMNNVKLHKTLKVLELACSICGSMPPHLDDTSFISSMGSSSSSSQTKFNGKGEYSRSPVDDALKVSSASGDECLTSEPSTYLFWAMAWTLLGDFYIELHQMKKKEISTRTQAKPSIEELGMLSEVEKEFKRLKKLGQDKQNCSYCSLVNCSCQSQSHRDRASSESTASTSSQDTRPLVYGKKQKRKSYAKRSSQSLFGTPGDDHVQCALEHKKSSESECLPHKRDGKTNIKASNIVTEKLQVKPLEATKKDEIFKYLGGPVAEELDCYLNAALSCFEEARKACDGLPCDSTELQSAHKKIGWVCNELGKNRLERKELHKAEIVFEDAINAFRKVSDHTSIVVIHCNVGYGRRALADELVLDMENLKTGTWDATRYNLYIKAIEGIKSEYRKSIGHFEAAKTELYFAEETGNVESTNEVYTQMAHTYLSLGMFRAKEEKEGRVAEDTSNREHEISANDAMEKACSLYESLGELRKQEAANAYFQLACYQRDRSLKVLETGHKKRSSCKGENSILQRVKQYADLAERNWLKAMDFYGSKTYPPMYLSILMERATLPLIISSHFHSNAMLESALSYLLEGRHLSDSDSDTFRNKNPQLHDAFWHLLQKVIKEMLTLSKPATDQPNKNGVDVEKLKELYKRSLKSTDLVQLHVMCSLWTS